MKKYELLANDNIVLDGKTLYRLRALRNFGDVKAGDLGGYIEKEYNLSHAGNCWVFNNARVCGGAAVYNDAQVYGNALVLDRAIVHDYAKVFNNAMVSNKAHIMGKAMVFGNTTICGYATVSDNAMVSGKAYISDCAGVYGSSQLYGDAELSGNAVVSNAEIHLPSDIVWFSHVGRGLETLTVYKSIDGSLLVNISGITFTVERFLAEAIKSDKKETYREFELLIKVAESRILGEKL